MKIDVPQMFVSELLPPDARTILQRAAATRIDADPMARKKAIDRANKEVRRMYPKFFKSEAPADDCDDFGLTIPKFK